MFDKLKELETEYDELTSKIGESITNLPLYQEMMKKRAKLEPAVLKFKEYKGIEEEILKLEPMLNNEPELKEMVEEELQGLQERKKSLEEKLQELLTPKEEYPEEEIRHVIMEIRAGTGGEESGLFAADLFRMYSKYAVSMGWKLEMFNSNPTGIGGFKEVIFGIEGERVYQKLMFEAGTHRVQRVPVTEASGRVHTSAVTVAILKEPEEVEIEISPEDLKIDTYRSSGAGGQHVNVTDSAIRITHLPTGLIVTCQDERSQHKNRAKAMRVLRARLLEMAEIKAQKELAQERKSQVGTGDRSEKIRTYNYPQNRITDHRIGLSLYKLENIMDGDLDELVSALISAAKEQRLK
ncbi:MAG: peptide chain release factor 1 [bacterium]|nr:peptide chain release factor 1 [bacterium]